MTEAEIRNCDLTRIYAIQHEDEAGIVAGHNPAGEQLLVGDLDNELLVALFFSPDGRYLRYALRPVLEKPDPTRDMAERLQWGFILQKTMLTYMQELELTPGTIHIHHFAFPEWGIGIAEWPWGTFEEVRESLLRTGKLPDDEFIRDWARDRRWVLYWKKDYWMNEDGTVGDT
jgi:hypothetical protein